MPRHVTHLLIACLGVVVVGCQSTGRQFASFQSHPAEQARHPHPLLVRTQPHTIVRPKTTQPTATAVAATDESAPAHAPVPLTETSAVDIPAEPPLQPSTAAREGRPLSGPVSAIQQAGHQDASPAPAQAALLTIDGRTYRVELIEEVSSSAVVTANAADEAVQPPAAVPPEPNAEDQPAETQEVELSLSAALGMIGGRTPAVGFAQWRVQEAYAEVDRAEALWLPSIRAGLGFHRHDGNYQNAAGRILDVNRSSFQYGLGAGAVGAGTVPIPGIVAQFHTADAIFEPRITEKTAWARGHAANAELNTQLLNTAIAYNSLMAAEQEVRVLEDSRDRMQSLEGITRDFAETGRGLQADADRMATEVSLVESRILSASERADVASARLIQVLSLNAARRVIPAEPVLTPINLVPVDLDSGSLISTGLSTRPELKEAQAQVAAACERYQRQRYAPFVPSVLLGFSSTEFGGGFGNSVRNVDDRLDFDALMTWEVRTLGQGEQAARGATRARVEQARFEKVRLMDQVAREVSEASVQSRYRRERIAIAERAIASAEDSWRRNVIRIRDGHGLPIEVLQSVLALETARREYVAAVADYNAAQFQLQWALGWPVHSTGA